MQDFRKNEDRRDQLSNKKRTIGRRKYEIYSYYTYKITIMIMFTLVAMHIGLVLLNLK